MMHYEPGETAAKGEDESQDGQGETAQAASKPSMTMLQEGLLTTCLGNRSRLENPLLVFFQKSQC